MSHWSPWSHGWASRQDTDILSAPKPPRRFLSPRSPLLLRPAKVNHVVGRGGFSSGFAHRPRHLPALMGGVHDQVQEDVLNGRLKLHALGVSIDKVLRHFFRSELLEKPRPALVKVFDGRAQVSAAPQPRQGRQIVAQGVNPGIAGHSGLISNPLLARRGSRAARGEGQQQEPHHKPWLCL